MSRKTNYDDWSKEELIKEIVKIKSTTYGLVWHRDLPEEKIDILVNPDARTPNEMFPNELAGKPFPILKEVRGKAIESDKSKLVNLLIEGDNYHSLAVLNFTHHEAIDLIYIDPPYNTGNNDFTYNDKFVDKEDSFRHSKWLSFMEKRLKLARNLLKDKGVIFISIDDNEQAPLKMLCDEIFGEANFAANFIWKSKGSGAYDTRGIKTEHEYILLYAKNIDSSEFNSILFDVANDSQYKYEDEKSKIGGKYKRQALAMGTLTYSPSLDYGVMDPDGNTVYAGGEKGGKYIWRWKEQKLATALKEGFAEWVKTKNGWSLYSKQYQYIDYDGKPIARSIQATTVIDNILSRHGTRDLQKLFNEKIFDYPKPVDLIKKLLVLASKKESVILDFMAGSGTTGQAVIELNKEDGGNRKFILCTNNGDEKSEHKIASEICYPRIKKVIEGHNNKKGKKVNGVSGNLKYYTTDFIEAEPTDKNKRKLVKESADMLCILENAFELISETPEFKIFKNTDKYLGVIFYEDAIDDYKKAINKIDGHFNTYVFSMGDDPHTKRFVDIKNKVTLCAIPEVILRVYREIFK